MPPKLVLIMVAAHLRIDILFSKHGLRIMHRMFDDHYPFQGVQYYSITIVLIAQAPLGAPGDEASSYLQMALLNFDIIIIIIIITQTLDSGKRKKLWRLSACNIYPCMKSKLWLLSYTYTHTINVFAYIK